MPEHTFKTPVPVVVRIVWEHDGEEQIETEALGWTDRRRVRAATRQPVEVHLRVAGRQRRDPALTGHDYLSWATLSRNATKSGCRT